MLVIDAHAHLISSDAIDALRDEMPQHAPMFVERDGGRFLEYPTGRISGPLPPGMFDLAVRLSDMDRVGVDVQLLSPNPPQFGYSLDEPMSIVHSAIVNDATIATAEEAPERLLTLLTLPLPHVDAADYCFDMASDDPVADVRRLGLATADESAVLGETMASILDRAETVRGQGR
jgi:aminocarboxymuconate-semialdehyde decarboxylase